MLVRGAVSWHVITGEATISNGASWYSPSKYSWRSRGSKFSLKSGRKKLLSGWPYRENGYMIYVPTFIYSGGSPYYISCCFRNSVSVSKINKKYIKFYTSIIMIKLKHTVIFLKLLKCLFSPRYTNCVQYMTWHLYSTNKNIKSWRN
jgi:hypothetical protein